MITYQRILVKEHSTFYALHPDRSTLAPPPGDILNCRKRTKYLRPRNCSHFSGQTLASQGPHMAPECILFEKKNQIYENILKSKKAEEGKNNPVL